MLKNISYWVLALLAPTLLAAPRKNLPSNRHNISQLLYVTVSPEGEELFENVYISILENFKSNPKTQAPLTKWVFAEKEAPRPLLTAIADLNELLNELRPHQIVYSQEKPTASEPSEKFIWGLALESVSRNYPLLFSFSGFIENSSVPQSTPVPQHSTVATPNTKHLRPQDYDLALHVNQGLFNRALQLAFEAGNLKDTKFGTNKIQLLYQPILIAPTVSDNGKDGRSPLLRMRLRFAMNISGMLQRAMVRDPATIELEIEGRMSISKNAKKITLSATRIDTSSLYIDESSFTFIGRRFRHTILSNVQNELARINATWQATPQVLPFDLSIPTEALGEKLQIEELVFDPEGYLSVYLSL